MVMFDDKFMEDYDKFEKDMLEQELGDAEYVDVYCSHCDGSGTFHKMPDGSIAPDNDEMYYDPDYQDSIEISCPYCHGTGK